LCFLIASNSHFLLFAPTSADLLSWLGAVGSAGFLELVAQFLADILLGADIDGVIRVLRDWVMSSDGVFRRFGLGSMSRIGAARASFGESFADRGALGVFFDKVGE